MRLILFLCLQEGIFLCICNDKKYFYLHLTKITMKIVWVSLFPKIVPCWVFEEIIGISEVFFFMSMVSHGILKAHISLSCIFSIVIICISQGLHLKN